MNLRKPYGPRDEQSGSEGDDFFIGVDERTPAQRLPAGYVASARNMRFRRGRAETRPGIVVCPWMKGTGYTPWTEVYTATVFSDPNQPAEWLVIAADGGVWKTRPHMTATRVPLPVNTSLTADTAVMFVQCFNVLILLRGPDADPLVCTDLDVGFTAVPAATGEGMRDMPKASFGMFYLNRLWLIEGKDQVACSDILDYTKFPAVINELRINSGGVDGLVALSPLARGTVICIKDQGVHALQNVTVGLGEVLLSEVTDKYGGEAWRGVARSGQNLYWVSEGGHVASLALTQQNEVQDTNDRLSEPMIQTFGRVNPLYLAGAAAVVWDGKLYVALPLDEGTSMGENWVQPGTEYWDPEYFWPHYADVNVVAGKRYFYQQHTAGWGSLTNGTQGLGSSGWFVAQGNTVRLNSGFHSGPGQPMSPQPVRAAIYGVSAGVNNAVAVYDFANQAWCGVDQAEGVVNVRHWLKMKYRGRKRLFAIGADGVLRLYEEGYEDEVLTAGVVSCQGIQSELVTRGYQCQLPGRKRFTAGALQVRTWAPCFSAGSQGPAQGSRVMHLENMTRSATETEAHGGTPYDPTNANDDHDAAGRQDYHLTANVTGWKPGKGVNLDAHQAGTVRVPIDAQAPWQQLVVSNSEGRIGVDAAGLEALPAEQLSGTTV